MKLLSFLFTLIAVLAAAITAMPLAGGSSAVPLAVALAEDKCVERYSRLREFATKRLPSLFYKYKHRGPNENDHDNGYMPTDLEQEIIMEYRIFSRIQNDCPYPKHIRDNLVRIFEEIYARIQNRA